MGRWRGRRFAGLAAVLLVAAGLTASAAAAARDGDARWIVARDAAGVELARERLPATNEFVLRYRNSVYDSVAEERYRVADGHLELVALAADELAVLEEYSSAFGAIRDAPDSRLTWSVAVERPAIALPLRVQATALGERTLLVDGREVALWRLVTGRDDTLVILTVEARRA